MVSISIAVNRCSSPRPRPAPRALRRAPARPRCAGSRARANFCPSPARPRRAPRPPHPRRAAPAGRHLGCVLGIVHAKPLDQLFTEHPERLAECALFRPEASSETLNAPAWATRVAEQARALEKTAARLEQAAQPPEQRARLAAARRRLSELSSHAYRWDHESDGTVPLAGITVGVRAEAQRLIAYFNRTMAKSFRRTMEAKPLTG